MNKLNFSNANEPIQYNIVHESIRHHEPCKYVGQV